jgi:histidinol-phosphate aminotransferase
MVGIGNGSDQILDLVLSNFASKKTKILTSNPTFGFFEERCKLYQIPTIKVPFTQNMTLDVDDFLSKSKQADILYLDSPNNPTGFQFKKDEITELVKKFDGLIIIDEAYGEFSDYSVANMTKKFDNLIVVKTFSKTFGLAGLRLGYVLANKKFIDVFSRVLQYPYPLNTIAIEGGILALQKINQVQETTQAIKEERTRIIKKLRESGAFDVFDSKANFVLFDARGADKRIYTALLEQGISVRKLGEIGKHEGCLRVTVGTKDMNSKFLLAIRDLLK